MPVQGFISGDKEPGFDLGHCLVDLEDGGIALIL